MVATVLAYRSSSATETDPVKRSAPADARRAALAASRTGRRLSKLARDGGRLWSEHWPSVALLIAVATAIAIEIVAWRRGCLLQVLGL